MCRRARDHQPGRSHHLPPPQSCECMCGKPQGTPATPGPWHLLLWHLGPPPRDVVAPPALGVLPRGVLTASPRRLQSPPRTGPQKAWTPPTPAQEPGPDPSSFPGHPPCPLRVLLPSPSQFPANLGAEQSWGSLSQPWRPEARSERSCPRLSRGAHLPRSLLIPGSKPPLIAGPPHPTPCVSRSELPCSFENTCPGTEGHSSPSDLAPLILLPREVPF